MKITLNNLPYLLFKSRAKYYACIMFKVQPLKKEIPSATKTA
jgi:hypothetical protein